MARYTVNFNDTNSDNTSLGYVYQPASPTRRPAIRHIILGSKAAPADNAVQYEFQRMTAENGTPGGTSVTPSKLDPADGAALTLARTAPTGEPTLTANEYPLIIPKNMRPTVQWIASPGFELVIPATAANGISCVADTPTTAYAESCVIMFTE